MIDLTERRDDPTHASTMPHSVPKRRIIVRHENGGHAPPDRRTRGSVAHQRRRGDALQGGPRGHAQLVDPADEGDRREVHVATRQLAPVGGAALHVTVTAVSLVAG